MNNGIELTVDSFEKDRETNPPAASALGRRLCKCVDRSGAEELGAWVPAPASEIMSSSSKQFGKLHVMIFFHLDCSTLLKYLIMNSLPKANEV